MILLHNFLNIYSMLTWSILLGIGIGGFIGLIFYYLMKITYVRRIEKRKGHWIQSKQINRQEERIEMEDGQKIQAYVYSSDVTPVNAPSILFLHGLGGYAQDLNFEQILSSLCLSGFRVFAYDFRASGKSRNEDEKPILKKLEAKFVQKIYEDVSFAFEWMYSHDGVDQTRLYAIGASFGGSMVLTRLLHESRLQKIIAICAPYDFREVFENNFKTGNLYKKFIYYSVVKNIQNEEAFLECFYRNSPINFIKSNFPYQNRIFLAHCKDDEIIPFQANFLRIKAALNLPKSNCLIFEKGGHEFKGNPAPLISRICFWLQKN